MRYIKQLMLVGVLVGSIAAATASGASADVPCGLSWYPPNPGDRYGWNLRNCNNHGVNWRIAYYGAVVGDCYYIPPNSIKVGSSEREPGMIIDC